MTTLLLRCQTKKNQKNFLQKVKKIFFDEVSTVLQQYETFAPLQTFFVGGTSTGVDGDSRTRPVAPLAGHLRFALGDVQALSRGGSPTLCTLFMI